MTILRTQNFHVSTELNLHIVRMHFNVKHGQASHTHGILSMGGLGHLMIIFIMIIFIMIIFIMIMIMTLIIPGQHGGPGLGGGTVGRLATAFKSLSSLSCLVAEVNVSNGNKCPRTYSTLFGALYVMVRFNPSASTYFFPIFTQPNPQCSVTKLLQILQCSNVLWLEKLFLHDGA